MKNFILCFSSFSIQVFSWKEEVREWQGKINFLNNIVKGDKFEHITHESESSLFQCYVGYMYYLSHLKGKTLIQRSI